MLKWILTLLLVASPSVATAQRSPDGAAAEAVVRALIDAGNRSDVETWLSLFHPEARHYLRSQSDHALADRPSTRISDSLSRREFYEEVFSRPQKTRGEIVELISLGELVMARGIFHRPEGPLHTLTVYRVRDGQVIDIWDVDQIAE